MDNPDQYTPHSSTLPTAEEVAPWVEAIIRFWDDPDFHTQQRQRCLDAAEQWRPERLAPRLETILRQVLASRVG